MHPCPVPWYGIADEPTTYGERETMPKTLTHDEWITVARQALEKLDEGATTLTKQQAAMCLAELAAATRRLAERHGVRGY